jgi:hypothetical protein
VCSWNGIITPFNFLFTYLFSIKNLSDITSFSFIYRFLFFYSSLLWDVFIINSVEQLQTLPKTQSEIDISPFPKNKNPPLVYCRYIQCTLFPFTSASVLNWHNCCRTDFQYNLCKNQHNLHIFDKN